MPVHIGEKHLKRGTTRKTYSDSTVKGFALRTTPQGTFSFYYQHLNKHRLDAKGKPKRDWHLIGEHPAWSIERARNEARGLAKLAGDGKSIRQTRDQRQTLALAAGVTFQQLHDDYLAYCKELVTRRWGVVPRKESWEQVQDKLSRPRTWWATKPIADITDADIMELYESWTKDGFVAMANSVRSLLGTVFGWAMITPRKWLTKNPCDALPEMLEENSEIEDGRVLDADEIRRFWFGVDEPGCPGDRMTKLALKLSMVTMLRSGEIVAIPTTGITPETITIPLKVCKGRRSKKARPVTQPLNSLAREILGEVYSVGDPDRAYAFPGGRKGKRDHMEQRSLSSILSRNSEDGRQQMGVLQYLGMEPWTPHDLRRTSATILEQLGFDDGLIGKVMTHKATGKDVAPVTRAHYLVAKQIIARPVDPRIAALDALDTALREILGLPAAIAAKRLAAA
jgi:integrase